MPSIIFLVGIFKLIKWRISDINPPLWHTLLEAKIYPSYPPFKLVHIWVDDFPAFPFDSPGLYVFLVPKQYRFFFPRHFGSVLFNGGTVHLSRSQAVATECLEQHCVSWDPISGGVGRDDSGRRWRSCWKLFWNGRLHHWWDVGFFHEMGWDVFLKNTKKTNFL